MDRPIGEPDLEKSLGEASEVTGRGRGGAIKIKR